MYQMMLYHPAWKTRGVSYRGELLLAVHFTYPRHRFKSCEIDVEEMLPPTVVDLCGVD